MWSKIINPLDGKRVNINSKLGKQILLRYITQSGGAAQHQAAPLPSAFFFEGQTALHCASHAINHLFQTKVTEVLGCCRAKNGALWRDAADGSHVLNLMRVCENAGVEFGMPARSTSLPALNSWGLCNQSGNFNREVIVMALKNYLGLSVKHTLSTVRSDHVPDPGDEVENRPLLAPNFDNLVVDSLDEEFQGMIIQVPGHWIAIAPTVKCYSRQGPRLVSDGFTLVDSVPDAVEGTQHKCGDIVTLLKFANNNYHGGGIQSVISVFTGVGIIPTPAGMIPTPVEQDALQTLEQIGIDVSNHQKVIEIIRANPGNLDLVADMLFTIQSSAKGGASVG